MYEPAKKSPWIPPVILCQIMTAATSCDAVQSGPAGVGAAVGVSVGVGSAVGVGVAVAAATTPVGVGVAAGVGVAVPVVQPARSTAAPIARKPRRRPVADRLGPILNADIACSSSPPPARLGAGSSALEGIVCELRLLKRTGAAGATVVATRGTPRGGERPQIFRGRQERDQYCRASASSTIQTWGGPSTPASCIT